MTRFVTSNDSKFMEVSGMLRDCGVEVHQLKATYPEVQADTLKEVVMRGLEWLSPRYGDHLLVDDSGLFIGSLGGFPGVYSSYVYRTLGCGGVLKLLAGSRKRDAAFEACFGLASEGTTVVFEGRCPGRIAEEERGSGGFGFDPIFIPKGHSRTFGEMGFEEKNAISHRGRAVDQLVRHLTGEARLRD